MHVNNYTLPRPPQHLLDQCTEVVVGDPAFRMWEMRKWCRENAISLVWSEIVNTTDVSSMFDEGADATAFRLKFT